MEELLPSLKVIISDGGTQTLMPLDSFNKTEEIAPAQESAVTGEEGEEE